MMSSENDNNPTPGGPEQPNYARQAQAAADRAKAAAQDALGAARRLVINPAGSIGDAHASLGADRVLGVAVVFALVAAIGLALVGDVMARAMFGAMMGGLPGGAGFGFSIGAFLKSVLMNLIAIVAVGGGVLLIAPFLGGRIAPASALFVGTTACLPLGIAALAAALIGSLFKNQFGMILVSLLMLYGLSYLVMVLNAGLRQIAGVDERQAAFGTPTVLAFAAIVMWLVGKLFN
jgi:hypothetical protein